jgi:hypothetical protein
LKNEDEEIRKNIEIWPIHSYIINQLRKNGIYMQGTTNNKFFKEELPQEYLKHNFEKFDVLIVDEAQDLLNYYYIDTFDKMLNKGLKDGIWYMALDPSQNIYNVDFNEVFEYIKTEIRPTIKRLSDNCRNTKQISYQNELFTQVEQAKNEIINGNDVQYIKYTDNEEQKKQLKEIIKELKQENIDLNDIVILSKYTFDNSVFRGENFLKGICDIKFSNEYFDETKEGITFSTIYSFKGLESSVIILCDVDKLENEHNQLLNYVAISRSKELLYILLNEEAFEEYNKNVIKTYKKLLRE